MVELNCDLISLNTAGLRDYEKCCKVFHYLKQQVSKSAIIFMQETHTVKSDEKIWTNQFGCGSGSIIFSHGKSDARGVLIAFHEELNYRVITQHVDNNGRYIVLYVLIDNDPVILVNYYAPNVESEQLKLLDELNYIFNSFEIAENTVFIWGGDFNMIFDTTLDVDGGFPKLKINSLSKILLMMSENDLCDIFRVRNPDTRRFSWRRKTPFKQRRLDFFLVSDTMQENIESTDIIPSVGSDHSAIKIKLCSLQEGSRGQGYWKFNSSLTEDKNFVESLKTEISNFRRDADQFDDVATRWEFMKYKCREYSRNYSIQMAKTRKRRHISLEKRVAELESLITSNSNDQLLKEYSSCKLELESLYEYITSGIILRSKTNWYEHGEKSSKYFLNLEKRNKAKSHLRKLMTSSDTEVHDPVVIMSHIRSFYSSLYKRRSSKNEKECLEYLRSFNLPQISSSERESCEGLLTRKECWEALQSMKNRKSPGNDGLTKEFYVCFFNEISPLLIDVLNHSHHTGQLSSSQRQALITLIEKKEKDKSYIKNWRPISLINVDAKLASKVLAGRIKRVLPNIIKHDQTAYVTGRYIGESIHLISDMLEYTEENNIDGILFSADFEKAFDSVEHSFILATLQSFGFGPQFIHWVRVILNKAESCVMNNGHSTGYFPLERGCRQGDPLSAYLFIICVEVLFIQVRENDDINGIKIDDREIKLSAFVDDADFLIANVKSLKLIFDIRSRFQSYSSLKLNLEKSEACWIGRARGSNNTPIGCRWVDLNNQAIRTLGIFNSYDQDLVQKLNFLDNLKCLSEVLQLW